MVEVHSATSRFRHWRHTHTFLAGILFSLAIFSSLSLGLALGFVRLRAFLPGTQIAGLDVSWLDGESAAFLLAQKIGASEGEFVLTVDGKSWTVSQETLGVEYDLPATINQAWLVGRQGSVWERINQLQQTLAGKTNLDLVVKVDESKLATFLAKLGNNLDDPAIKPSLSLNRKREVVLNPGKNGVELDQTRLGQQLQHKFAQLDFAPLPFALTELKVALNPDQAKDAVALGQSFLDRRLVIQAPDTDDWVLDETDLITLLALDKPGFEEEDLTKIITDYSLAVYRLPQNAAFQFVGGKVEEFRPGKDGLEVESEKLLAAINQNFDRLQRESVTMDAPAIKTPPAVTTESVNNLGIKERLGLGQSTYKHSIPNRIYNVDLTASRLNGILVAPGEIFSFNNAVGDISAATGFKAAYVIKEGRTVLGDGGGVCQVSTTMFRAALNAGLPIEERKAHAYRVGYYEQNSLPGIDATVYAPSADFKFKNDTPGWLLIQTINDPKTQDLAIEIYGTSDGRVAQISEPVVWGQSPPPPALHQDDPSLAPGETKQVDWAASGAKTKFDYTVTREGEVLFEKTFYSTYRPWQAVYLHGPQI